MHENYSNCLNGKYYLSNWQYPGDGEELRMLSQQACENDMLNHLLPCLQGSVLSVNQLATSG